MRIYANGKRGIYWVRATLADGRRIKRSSGTADRAAAEEWAARLVADDTETEENGMTTGQDRPTSGQAGIESDNKIASWRSSAENERRYSERVCFLVATTDDEMVAIFRALDERDALKAENEALREELERERIRLSACGVVALSNTRESAKVARDMSDEYRSDSCSSVAAAVDREMALREERDELRKRVAELEGQRDSLQLRGDRYRDTLSQERRLVEECEVERDALKAENSAMRKRVAELERGEFICRKCGLRKDAERDTDADF